MKTVKLILSVISIVLFIVIVFQSCAAGVADALENEGGVSGAAGMFVAFLMLVAGIVGLVTRSSKAGGIVTACFYLLAGIIGIAGHGVYADLVIWSVMSLAFGITFLVGSILMKKKPKDVSAE